jgi:hypothetical protein
VRVATVELEAREGAQTTYEKRAEYIAQYYRQRRLNWKSRGRCGLCGSKLKTKKLTCEKCLEKQRNNTQRYRERLKEKACT